METAEKSKIDERDLWTVEEVERMRSAVDSKRKEAIFELLAYTGQRVRVIQTLRVRDVDPDKGDTGRYWVNEKVGGRKNREGHGPLLGARGAVRRWLQVHPTKNPQDALISSLPENSGGATPGDRLTKKKTIRDDVLKPIAERAGVDKKVNSHMFWHYFTIIAKRPKSRGGFGMDPDYIKRLRGDSPGSNVMETTYSQLVEEDASEYAEAAFTGEPIETVLTPAGPCGNCGNMLDAGDKACPVCGSKRAPDAVDSSVEELVALLSNADDEEVGAALREHLGA